MGYKCNICDKNYSSYQSLWIHNKKFHVDSCCKVTESNGSGNGKVMESNGKVIENNILNCKYCNKLFKCKQNRYEHEKKVCKPKDNLIQQINNNNIQQINNNITNNNNTTNNQQNIIVIQQLGRESISDFSIKEISRIINSGSNSPLICTELLHFSKDRPQYQIMCNTSLEGQYLNVIDTDTQKPKKVHKKDQNDKILLNSIKYINNIQLEMEIDKEFADKFNSEEKQKILDIVNKSDKYLELKNIKTHYKFLNEISYNFREIIKNTWKCLQPIEETDENMHAELYKKYQMNTDTDTDSSTDI